MANPGFRAPSSLWWGPDGSTNVVPVITGGFRSYASLWFGPEAGGGGGVTPPVVPTSGRKLISPHLAATIHGDLT